MRLLAAISCVMLLLGCHSVETRRREADRITSALEKRITVEQARHIVLDVYDHAIQTADNDRTPGARAESETLAKKRQRLNSRLETFLGCYRPGDELWSYRTYVTPDRHGGERGLAILRAGVVIEHMGLMVYD